MNYDRYMKIIDLHTHSIFSDGTHSPSELVLLAKESKLSAIALTDHDSVSGQDEMFLAGKKQGIEVIPGVELVAEYKAEEIHILGYFIDYKGQYFTEAMNHFLDIRADRNERLIKRLRSLKMNIPESDLDTGGKTLTRLHFAKALVKNGYERTIEGAFEKYLNPGRPAYVGRNAPSYEECIQTINRADGIAVLAHPFSYKWEGGEVTQMLCAMSEAGIGGAEAIYPQHTPAQTAILIKAAKQLNIAITGGSDFHGSNRPQIKLGTGKDNISVEYGILEELKKRHGKNTAF